MLLGVEWAVEGPERQRLNLEGDGFAWIHSRKPISLSVLSVSNPNVQRVVFLVLALSTAGALQVLWLRSRFSQKFCQPVDLGLQLRGRPLFGPNKTLRGFVMMVPAAGLSFLFWSQALEGAERVWSLRPTEFVLFGCVAGLGFMAGELPNSAFKRQLDIPPGEAPKSPSLRRLCLFLDRTDSLLGSLFAMSLYARVPWPVWLGCLAIGPGIHALFSFSLYRLGVKRRAA